MIHTWKIGFQDTSLTKGGIYSIEKQVASIEEGLSRKIKPVVGNSKISLRGGMVPTGNNYIRSSVLSNLILPCGSTKFSKKLVQLGVTLFLEGIC